MAMGPSDWDERYSGADYVWTDRANTFVERYAADLPAGSAVDLACGEGRNAVWLAARGWRVTAVDFSSAGLAKASRLAADRGVAIEAVEADVTSWEPPGPVDLVVIAYLQLPEPARSEVLSRAAGWVAPGGTLLLVAHDRSNVTDGVGGPPDPAVCYDLDQTLRAIRPLVPSVAEVARRPVETPDGSRDALDTVVVAGPPAGEG